MAEILSDQELHAAMADRPHWETRDNALERSVQAPSFLDGVDLVVKVARVAEEREHHPDIDIRWTTVIFRLSTHSAGGITSADVELAGAIDALVDELVTQTARLLENLDRQARPLAAGFTWDAEDANTDTWWPQGLTTSADGKMLLSAWYAKGRRGEHAATRISVVDLVSAAPRYAHVQLLDRGEPVRVHAGGLALRGSRLLVADTWQGMRVFDLSATARDSDGQLTLSQVASWSPTAWAGHQPLRWSFLSLDASVPGELWLIAGEYDRRGSGARLTRWAADPETALPDSTEPAEVVPVGIASMQGAVRVDGTYVVAASDGRRRRGHLWTGRTGGEWRQHREALPVGPEDLTYDRVSGRLWTQTEYPGQRIVLSLPLPRP